MSDEQILTEVGDLVQNLSTSPGKCSSKYTEDYENNFKNFNEISTLLDGFEEEFQNFTAIQCAVDENFKFWHKFIHQDCFAYISLYLAIRGENWTLRNYSIKMMAPLFYVVGSRYYYKLLPYHFADLNLFQNLFSTTFLRGICYEYSWKQLVQHSFR